MRRLIVALIAAGAATLIGAPAASAAHVAGLRLCERGAFTATYNGTNGFDVTVEPPVACLATIQSDSVPATWDGHGFDASAVPQKLYAAALITIETHPATYTIGVPACGPYQVDLTASRHGQPVVTSKGTRHNLAGGMSKGTPCGTPTPTPTCAPNSPLPGCHGIPTPTCLHPASCKPTHHPTSRIIQPVKGTPTGSGTPAARVRLASSGTPATLAYTGGVPWVLVALALVGIAVGLSLRFSRFTRAARRH